jgi:hypothetical protein
LGEYRTYNTPLVAWLLLNNIPYPEMKLEGKSVVFYFKNPDEKVLKEWQSGIAIGNCADFYHTYTNLLKTVNELKNKL